MNWTNTENIYQQKKFHITKVVTSFCLTFVVCLISVCWIHAIPMVSCQAMDHYNPHKQQEQNKDENFVKEKFGSTSRNIVLVNNNGYLDTNNDNGKKHIYPTDEWTSGQNNKDDGFNSKRMKAKLRKGFKNKNNKNHSSNNLLLNKKNLQKTETNIHFKYAESEKKYFDYFPQEKIQFDENNDTEIVDESNIDENIKVVLLPYNDNDDIDVKKSKKNHKNKQHNNHHRRHRNKSKKISNDNESNHSENLNDKLEKNNNNYNFHQRSKRNVHYNDNLSTKSDGYNNYDQQHRIQIRNRRNSPLLSEESNVIRRKREPLNGHHLQYYSQSTPWNNRFVQPPQVKYSIRGIYYNPLSPPGASIKPFTSKNDDVGVRFGEDEPTTERPVIWDIKYVTPASPLNRRPIDSNVINNSPRRTTPRPTTTRFNIRTTQQPTRKSTPPPLIHSPDDDEDVKNAQTTTSTFPPLGFWGAAADDDDLSTHRRTTRKPITTTTTRRPIAVTTTRPQPSKCVWAIVSCCSANNARIRYTCFEQIGCSGAFWDWNPCAEEYMDQALNAVEKFYEQP